MNYIIIPTESDYTSPILTSTGCSGSAVITDQQLNSMKKDTINADSSIYISSDTLFSSIQSNFTDNVCKQINLMRDKFSFRQQLQHIHPEFFFKKIKLNELPELKLPFSRSEQYIIKPCTGFMALGSCSIDKETNLKDLAIKLEKDVEYLNSTYPGIYQDQWLIEEKIKSNTEIAVDMYFNNSGMPKIINIYHHPKAKNEQYAQMLYYTSSSIVKKYKTKLIDYFNLFNMRAKIKNLPIHAEFFLQDDDSLIPIEFNAARFGGMGLADLSLHAYGHNPYTTFLNKYSINWERIIENDRAYYLWLLAYNGSQQNDGQLPDRGRLSQYIQNHADILDHKTLDHNKLPAFSIYYLRAYDETSIKKLLEIEFNNFYKKK